MRKYKVLHITPSVRLLGARQSLLTLVSNLAGSAFESLVAVPDAGDLTIELEKRHLPWVKLRMPPWRKAGSWTTMGMRISQLRSLIESEKIDLIHCNEIYPNPHAVTASAGNRPSSSALQRMLKETVGTLKIPVVTHMRLSVTPRMVKNYFLSDATRIIAVSNGAASDFDTFPWKAEKVRVVYNGIDTSKFAEACHQRNLVRSRMGFSNDHFVIAQIGLMMPRKRPMYLVEAARLLVKEVPNVRFAFIGDSSPGQESYLAEIKQMVRDAGLSDFVVFLPFQRNIAPYFGAIDLNMLVSSDEGFGRVIIEAGAAGIPTVGSNVGGIPELIDDGETGFLLGARNASDTEFEATLPAFVDIVKKLASDRQIYRRMGDAARKRASTDFSQEKYVAGVTEVFREALREFGK